MIENKQILDIIKVLDNLFISKYGKSIPNIEIDDLPLVAEAINYAAKTLDYGMYSYKRVFIRLIIKEYGHLWEYGWNKEDSCFYIENNRIGQVAFHQIPVFEDVVYNKNFCGITRQYLSHDAIFNSDIKKLIADASLLKTMLTDNELDKIIRDNYNTLYNFSKREYNTKKYVGSLVVSKEFNRVLKKEEHLKSLNIGDEVIRVTNKSIKVFKDKSKVAKILDFVSSPYTKIPSVLTSDNNIVSVTKLKKFNREALNVKLKQKPIKGIYDIDALLKEDINNRLYGKLDIDFGLLVNDLLLS